jgi:hypothetical protein
MRPTPKRKWVSLRTLAGSAIKPHLTRRRLPDSGAMKGSGMSYTSLNIDLSDLTAVKLTCAQCRASAEFPATRLQGDAPERCFHCRAEWFVPKSPQATALEHLFRALGDLRGDATTECRVQFVIDPGSPRTRVPF